MLESAELVAFVPATNAERATDFYGRLLGLPLLEETQFACVFQAGSVELRVTQVPAVEPRPYTVLGWAVADIETTARELRSAGVPPISYDELEQDAWGIWRSPSGARVLWFADPDGNILSITQR